MKENTLKLLICLAYFVSFCTHDCLVARRTHFILIPIGAVDAPMELPRFLSSRDHHDGLRHPLALACYDVARVFEKLR